MFKKELYQLKYSSHKIITTRIILLSDPKIKNKLFYSTSYHGGYQIIIPLITN